MNDKYKMIPKITLWSLIGLGIVFIAMFFLGGSNGSLEVAGDFLDIPKSPSLKRPVAGEIKILLGLISR